MVNIIEKEKCAKYTQGPRYSLEEYLDVGDLWDENHFVKKPCDGNGW